MFQPMRAESWIPNPELFQKAWDPTTGPADAQEIYIQISQILFTPQKKMAKIYYYWDLKSFK